ncbi:hypothetical protein ACLB2K_029503 [Fragaria x ananassa]
MSNEVAQRFSSVLALRDGGRLSFGVVRAAPAPTQFFAVGRLLTFKRKVPDPKAVIGTLSSVWDLQNRMQMRAREDRFVLRFTRANDRKHLLTGGPWFYGRSQFVLAEYDGFQDVASVPIESFPVWVDIKGLPDALWTEEAVEKVGLSLGFVEHLGFILLIKIK